jgi:hypothetical protein
MRRFTLFLIALIFALSGCEGSFPLGSAGLGDPAVSTAVDLKTKAPLEKAKIFPADVKRLYATVKLKNGSAGIKVKAVFYYLEGNRQQIAEQSIAAEGSGYLDFPFNPPESGWPVGRYEVEFFLDDQVKERIGFSVVPAADIPASKGFPATQTPAAPVQPAPGQDQAVTTEPAPAPPDAGTAPPAPGQADAPQGQAGQTPAPVPPLPGISSKTFQDKQFGFSFELPENWTFQATGANSDYLFSGQLGTPESEIRVLVQVVDTEKGVVGNLKDQMLALLNQYSRMSGAKVESKSQIQAAGQLAPFFLVTYTSEDSMKQQVTFGHTQLGLDHPPYLLLISYSAPREIYQQNVAVFQRMIDTLKLSPPATR